MGKVRKEPAVRIFKYFQVFANIFKWIYRQILSCGNRRKAFEKYDVMEEEMEEIDQVQHEEEVQRNYIDVLRKLTIVLRS